MKGNSVHSAIFIGHCTLGKSMKIWFLETAALSKGFFFACTGICSLLVCEGPIFGNFLHYCVQCDLQPLEKFTAHVIPYLAFSEVYFECVMKKRTLTITSKNDNEHRSTYLCFHCFQLLSLLTAVEMGNEEKKAII